MPMCEQGKEIPEQNITPIKLIVEEAWGELWRADHRMYGPVLFAAYTTALGANLFRKALPALQRMLTGGGVSTDFLLKVKYISEDSAIPYVLLEDPGGKTFLEFAGDETKVIDYEKIMGWGISWLDEVLAANNMTVVPLGITPSLLMYDASKKDTHPWRFAPILPGIGEQGEALAFGRYTPPELAASSEPSFVNADSYAITWILIEAMARDFNLMRDPGVAGQVLGSSPKLLMTLVVGIQCAGGMYPDAGTLGSQCKRWRRADMDTDLKAVRKVQAKEKKQIEKALKKGQKPDKKNSAKKSTPSTVGGTSSKHPGVITGVEQVGPGPKAILFSLLKVILIIGFVVGMGFGMKWLFVKGSSNKTANGTASLFMEGILLRDENKYKPYVSPQAIGQARALVQTIDYSSSSGASSKINQHDAIITDRQSGLFLGQTTLRGENGDSAFVVILEIKEKPDGTFHVTGVDWKGLGSSTFGL